MTVLISHNNIQKAAQLAAEILQFCFSALLLISTADVQKFLNEAFP